MKRLLALCALMSLTFSGCTYTMAVSQTNIPAQRKKPVEVSVKKFIVLGFNFDNDYALDLTRKLQERCPQGRVRGVTTHDTVTLYFLAFFWAREVKAQGYCLPQQNTASLEAEWGDIASSQE
ncbi:hypothetical protein [Oligoflexus tunisiensis]|uniref:hypothetical protein n=1 Tax=Oligoflexus tunisiensis TaxID=708132 RepID=UPI00114CD9ED|nr:hypothetical protein [Oligoflexus tunisiensis]